MLIKICMPGLIIVSVCMSEVFTKEKNPASIHYCLLIIGFVWFFSVKILLSKKGRVGEVVKE